MLQRTVTSQQRQAAKREMVSRWSGESRIEKCEDGQCGSDAPLCPLQVQGKTLRVQKHLTEICPDQVVQLHYRQHAQGSLFRTRRFRQRPLTNMGVVIVAYIGRASGDTAHGFPIVRKRY